MIEAPEHSPATPAFLRLLNPFAYLRAFGEVAQLFTRHRALTLEMARREVVREHAGKTLGAFWGVAQPLVFMLVYAFVFGIVFKQKIGGTYELPRNFTIYYLAGLVPWLAFQLALFKGTTAIVENAHIVKQVVFELEVLPVAGALAAAVSLTIGIAFIAIFTVAAYGGVPSTYLLLPVLFVIQVLAMAGVAFILSTVGTFLRDVKDFVQIFAVIGIFMMPIVYLPSSVPSTFRPLLSLNPFSYMVWCYQDVLYFGRIEHPGSWIVFTGWSLLSFVGGYRLFRKVKPYFGNVL